MKNFDPNFIPASCRGEKCSCGEPSAHKIEEVLFGDDPTAFIGESNLEVFRSLGHMPLRHPSTAYVCSKCFGKIMGRTTIPGFKN